VHGAAAARSLGREGRQGRGWLLPRSARAADQKLLDRHAENFRQDNELARREPVRAVLILLNLLEGDADALAQLGLGEAAGKPLCPHAGSNLTVQLQLSLPGPFRFHGYSLIIEHGEPLGGTFV